MRAALRQAMRGYTLVELLIALLLGAIATAGTLSAYAHGRASYVTQEGVNRLSERAQYVLSALEADLQLAGYYGLQGSAQIRTGAVPASAEACGRGLPTRLDRPIEVSDNAYSLACAPQGGGVMAGTDALTIRRASAQAAQPEPGRLQLLTSLAAAETGQLLGNGALPSGVVLAAGQTELRDLLVRHYYVARQADGSTAARGEPALRVKSLTRVGTAPTFVDTEVMPGVEDLQVSLGYLTALPGGTPVLRFITPDAAPPSRTLLAVQLSLRLRADAADPHYRDPQYGDAWRRLQVTRSYALRNPVQP